MQAGWQWVCHPRSPLRKFGNDSLFSLNINSYNLYYRHREREMAIAATENVEPLKNPRAMEILERLRDRYVQNPNPEWRVLHFHPTNENNAALAELEGRGLVEMGYGAFGDPVFTITEPGIRFYNNHAEEVQWLASNDPEWMLRKLDQNAEVNQRKLRLFAVACCRNLEIWNKLIPETQDHLDVAERFADGLATNRELGSASAKSSDAHADAQNEYTDVGSDPDRVYPNRLLWLSHRAVQEVTFVRSVNVDTYSLDCYAATRDAYNVINPGHENVFRAYAAALLRNIIGNPYRPVTFDPSWRTETVLALARQMYESRDFPAMPILADALQDAGCDDAEILNNCRGPGPHTRGCWVVDMILGRLSST